MEPLELSNFCFVKIPIQRIIFENSHKFSIIFSFMYHIFPNSPSHAFPFLSAERSTNFVLPLFGRYTCINMIISIHIALNVHRIRKLNNSQFVYFQYYIFFKLQNSSAETHIHLKLLYMHHTIGRDAGYEGSVAGTVAFNVTLFKPKPCSVHHKDTMNSKHLIAFWTFSLISVEKQNQTNWTNILEKAFSIKNVHKTILYSYQLSLNYDSLFNVTVTTKLCIYRLSWLDIHL